MLNKVKGAGDRSGLPEKCWSILLHLSTNMWVDTADNISTSIGYRDDLNDQFCETTWQAVTQFASEKGLNMVFIDLGNAIEYISHPEISVKNAWKPEKLRSELARLRSMGLTPIPKLNFSASHDRWLCEYERMLSTKIYYEVCRDLIHEVIELFDNPSMFHLGMDEEDPFTPEFLGYHYGCFRQFDLYWHDMNYLFDCVREKGVRPMIWFNIGSKRGTDGLFENVDKDVVLNPYHYDVYKFASHTKYTWNPAYVTDAKLNIVKVMDKLADAGYDIIPCGSTYGTARTRNIIEMVEYIEENISSERNFGYMVAPWLMTLPQNEYGIKNDIHVLSYAGKLKQKQ